MVFLRLTNLRAGRLLAAILPIGLWAALWLSLGAGTPRGILSPHSLSEFIQGLRAIFPFIAAFLAGLAVAIKVYRRPQVGLFLGPLGVIAIYGLVGILASLRSPDPSTAFYWAAVYFSVPLVLWAVAWGIDPLGQLHRIVNFTWLIIIFAVSILFSIAVVYLDLIDNISNPAGFFRCEDIGHWFDQTSGFIRSTGVGRYAALGVIVSFTGMWSGKSRALWALLLLACLMLLTSSGARTAMIGLGAAIITVTLIYTGKKGALAGVLVLVVLGTIHWATDVDQPFLDQCLLRSPVYVGLPIAAGIAQSSQGQTASSDPSTATSTFSIAPTSQVQAEATVTATEKSERLRVPQGQSSQGQAASSDSSTAASTFSIAPTSQAQVEATVAAQGSQSPDERLVSTLSNLSGRTWVWADGWRLIKQSPLLGYGFHADRLVLGKHMHNAYLHALLQTGILGTIFFLGALFWGVQLLLRALLYRERLPEVYKHSVVQMAGLMVFLAFRSLPESTGAFFGVDWFLVALLLMYLQAVNRVISKSVESA